MLLLMRAFYLQVKISFKKGLMKSVIEISRSSGNKYLQVCMFHSIIESHRPARKNKSSG